MAANSGGWAYVDGYVAPNFATSINSLEKTASYMKIGLNSVKSSTNVITNNTVDFTGYNKIKYDVSYYLPQQNWSGMNINLLDKNLVAYNIPEVTSETRTTFEFDVTGRATSKVSLSMVNGHTAIPYPEYIPNMYIMIHNIWLE